MVNPFVPEECGTNRCRLPKPPKKKLPRNSPDKIKKPDFGSEIEVKQLNRFPVSLLLCLRLSPCCDLLKTFLVVPIEFANNRLREAPPFLCGELISRR